MCLGRLFTIALRGFPTHSGRSKFWQRNVKWAVRMILAKLRATSARNRLYIVTFRGQLQTEGSYTSAVYLRPRICIQLSDPFRSPERSCESMTMISYRQLLKPKFNPRNPSL